MKLSTPLELPSGQTAEKYLPFAELQIFWIKAPMQHLQATERVRQLVASTFVRLQLGESDDVREAILIRGGSYCGRKFEGSNGSALWFLEENQVKFFDLSGKVLESCSAGEGPGRLVRVAA